MSTSATPAWCALKIEHDYYSQPEFAKLLELHPTRETQRFGVSVKTVDDQAIIYAPPRTARPPVLGFGIAFRDPVFWSYTDLRGEPPLDGKVLYLNPGTNFSIDVADSPRLGVQPRRFEFPFDQAIDAAQVGPIGGAMRPLKIGPEESRRQSVRVDLAGEPAGGYALRLLAQDRVISETSFYVSDLLSPPVAAWEWRPNPADLKPPTIALRFKALETFWRYYIIGLPEDLWPGTAIAPATTNGNGQPGIAFTAAREPYILPDGRKAMVYLSDAAIPRRQRQSLKVRLKSSSVFDGYPLPHAGHHLTYISDPSDRRLPCSDIFVQL